MTVCALPSSDLHTSPTRRPWALASMAARRPAPPAPMTSTSCSWVSNLVSSDAEDMKGASRPSEVSLKETKVGDSAARDRPDVEVGERHREEAHPREGHVPFVEHRDALPERVANATETGGRIGVHASADQVTKAVTPERVSAEQKDVEKHDEATDRDVHSVGPTDDPLDRVLPENDQEDDGNVQREPVQVLEQQEASLPMVAVRGALSDGASRGVPRKRSVVGLAVVVTGKPKARGSRQDQHRRCEEGKPVSARPANVEERRVEGREVCAPLVGVSFERPPRRVSDEAREHEDRRGR